ncbi:GNAT family N-acetyltransferase [Papillibacter cinnamivorans]|uniref:Phosphoglycolate phosphatase, HAD superfamily n=1 Tax=Papillibacter cinnamivorans DSM 12816 TaxID=1122930 RepID=A0A1W2A6S7_9FIRM|nr:GNAT family N-acetyltransferase [Papillibacter cinnamivorans]SMC56367.1 Phosphoglycolate phosphatase, HAD superfamily [Papillibacter cinnamivorans DSM 12816]
MKYSALLFDFDFTLADASEGIFQSYEYGFSKMGLPLPARDAIRQTIGMTLPDGYTYLTGDTDPGHRSEFHDAFVAMADKVMVPNTRFLPGAAALLETLGQRKIPAGIVSTKYSHRIVDFLAGLGKSDLVGCVIGLEKVKAPKPDPDGIRLGISLLGAAGPVLYVGDTTIDARAAQNAGVDFAAVLTGTTAREAFSAFPYVYIAEDLPSLSRWLFREETDGEEEPRELFRTATEADLPDIERLGAAAKDTLTAAGIAQWDEFYPTGEDFREDIRAGALHVLYRGGRLAAMAALDEFQLPEYREPDWLYREERACVFHRLCVAPALQGTGVGKDMLRQMDRLARSLGYGAVRLDAFSQNSISLRLYESSGYRRAGTVYFRKGKFFCYEKKL